MYDVMNQTYEVSVPGIHFHRLGVEIDEGLPYDAWEMALADMLALEGSFRWWIGGLINYGQAAYGEKYAQAIELTGLSYDALVDYAYVERSVPSSVRTELLTWSHHKQVAALPVVDQRRWLRRAISNGWTVSELKRAIKEEQQAAAERSLARAEIMQGQPHDIVPVDDSQGFFQARPGGEPDDAVVAEMLEAAEIAPANDLPAHDRWINLFDLAYQMIPDLSLYRNLESLELFGLDEQVLVDVESVEQEAAFRLLRAAYDNGDVTDALFVCDINPFAIARLWGEGAICLMEHCTLFYLGRNVVRFVETFQTEGVIVVPWRVGTAIDADFAVLTM